MDEKIESSVFISYKLCSHHEELEEKQNNFLPFMVKKYEFVSVQKQDSLFEFKDGKIGQNSRFWMGTS